MATPPAATPEAAKPEAVADAARTPFLKRRPVRIFAGLVVVAAIAGTGYWMHARNWEDTDDAFIDADVTQVAARVAGQVIEVKVADNQLVKAGDVLALIDPRDLDAAAARAKAASEYAKADAAVIRAGAAAKLAGARAGLVSAKAAAASAEAGLKASRADLLAAKANEAQRLNDEKRYVEAGYPSVSHSQLDNAKALAAEGRALVVSFENRVSNFAGQLDAAKAKVAAAEAEVVAAATVDERIAAAEATAARAKAELAAAELGRSYATIVAPVSGRVAKRAVRVGQYLRPGQALLAIVPQDYYVTANFKETQLAEMRPGQPVEIAVDAYPDFKLKGRVDSIQPGSGASFSLLPPENATGNYVKVVQRVPVKIVFENLSDEAREKLAVGLSVTPDVHVSETPAAK